MDIMTLVKDIEKKFASYPIFTYRAVSLSFKSKNLTRIISYMKKKGILFTVGKGKYTFSRDMAVSGFAYAPFYYGLLSSLTIRELWTQNSRPDIITLNRVRRSRIKTFDDKETVFLHHIPARYFFGFDLIKYGKFTVPVSDPEKTLIDIFYYKVKLSIQNYSMLLKIIDMNKLKRYLKRYDKRTSGSVLLFVKKHRAAAISGRLESPY